ncbi:MAG: 16S rRNA (guanine(966)-N(2))-methyltransferase RsmD [Defluviitaleaceae bacterium]|nr:16S rRNA (guanine(966)-N(2))-methyltransferase RsmD [Defluviitaleaceae bacterium]
MRVIAGSARRTTLVTPEGVNTRPTADRIKENLFNIIFHHVADAIFLDLFCGSGAIGIEALSRGAARAVFVDSSKEAIQATRTNLARTKFKNQAKVYQMIIPTLDWLGEERFDIIFMDPPYESVYLLQALAMIGQGKILSDDGILVAECAVGEIAPKVDGLVLKDIRKYGSTQLLFYIREI